MLCAKGWPFCLIFTWIAWRRVTKRAWRRCFHPAERERCSFSRKHHSHKKGRFCCSSFRDKCGAGAAATTAAVENLQAPELQYRAPAEGRRRGAVIGSAAKLNPEGVLAAAKEAEAREEARRKQVSEL